MDARSRYLPADERRAVTVDAVIALAGRQNPSEITTAAIARHMQLTQGALFRHFASKEAIWEAVMEAVAERLLARLDAAAQHAATAQAALQGIFMAHVDFAVEHPGVPRIVFGELQRGQPTPARRITEALMQRYAERVRRRIEAGQASGEIAPDVDAQAAATLLIGSIQGLAMQAMLSGDLPRMRAAAPGVYALFWRGIARAS